jgi:hypothetical protein
VCALAGSLLVGREFGRQQAADGLAVFTEHVPLALSAAPQTRP